MSTERVASEMPLVDRLQHMADRFYGMPDVASDVLAAVDEIKRLRSELRLAQFKVDILTNNEAVHLARLRKVDPEWVAAEARIAEDEAWWEANGKAELIAHLREHGLTIAGGEVQ